MKKYRWIAILLNLLLLLVYFGYTTKEKENLQVNGRLVLLELAPIDPRSLMQGDFMSLRYAIASNATRDSLPKGGYCVVRLDEDGVAQKIRFQENKEPLYQYEYLIKYTSSDWNINIGAESFFFQEGQSKKYELAKYGGIKVDEYGNSLLIGLYDDGRKQIR